MSKNIKNKQIFTVCGIQGCCPTVEITNDRVSIKDDFGGTVKLELEQWKDLGERIKNGEIPLSI